MRLHDLILACDSLTDERQTFPYSMFVFIKLVKKDSGTKKPGIVIGNGEHLYFSDVGALVIKERYLKDFLSRLNEVISLDSEDWTVAGDMIGNILNAGKSITKLAREIKKGMK